MKARQMAMLLAVMAVAACGTKDEFDSEKRQDYLADSFPVSADTLDVTHTWSLIREGYINITANVEGVSEVLLLTDNPYTNSTTELLARATVGQDETVTLNFVAPIYKTSLMAVALSSTGTPLAMAEVPLTSISADFTDTVEASGKYAAPTNQRIYYCFEEDFPAAGDWDYNDLVLSVERQSSTDDRVVHLNITLEATGTTSQLAAAIRLVGVSANNVEVTSPRSFFPTEQQVLPTFIKDTDLLRKARSTNEAVIALFDDQHLVFHPRLDTNGMPVRWMANVSHNSSASSWTPGAVSRDYYITFPSAQQAKNFTLAMLDPFIMHTYLGGIYEIHTFPYKLTNVLYQWDGNKGQSYRDNFCWAVTVPYAWFKWPTEGIPLGYYRDHQLTGAYMTPSHSFGQWLQNKETSADWYLYPSSGLVY